MKNCLAGERVYLRFGDEETDKYGRMLAYIFRAPDGMFVNLELVRQGYGRAYIRYPFEHMELFQAYETRAMESRKGLWGLSETESSADSSHSADSGNPTTATAAARRGGLETCPKTAAPM